MSRTAQRKELARFLRKRRSATPPSLLGLAKGRRRTPGLRREEVARAAGMSSDWYTWLEQAREVQASRDALRNIAHAMRLEPLETRYLLELGGFTAERNETHGGDFLQSSLVAIVHELCPCPCIVVGRRWDILMWNQAAEVLYGDITAMEGLERNGLWHYFSDGPFARTLEDRRDRAAKAVAIFRIIWSRWLGDPFFDQLIEGISAFSDEFAALWAGHEVAVCDPDMACFQHPVLGRLAFEHSAYDLNDSLDRGVRMIIYSPAPETDTRTKLSRYLSAASSSAIRDGHEHRVALAAYDK